MCRWCIGRTGSTKNTITHRSITSVTGTAIWCRSSTVVACERTWSTYTIEYHCSRANGVITTLIYTTTCSSYSTTTKGICGIDLADIIRTTISVVIARIETQWAGKTIRYEWTATQKTRATISLSNSGAWLRKANTL